MVKSIVVTDSAPIKEDNVLYFEYEPVSSVVLRSSAEKKIPRFSNAEIKNKFIKNNSGILNLILENPTDNTYKRVRILLRNNSKESGNLIIQDSDFNKVGTNTSYISSGSNTVNGVAIDGDPGATAQYTFTLTLNAVENETVDARTQQITVEGAGGSSVSATLTLNQTAGDPTLEVSPTSIDVPQDGSEVQVQVTTNTTFTVS